MTTQNHLKIKSHTATNIDLPKLRQRFFKKLRKEVITWGGETLDLAWTYYPVATQELKDRDSHSNRSTGLVVDRINLPSIGCSSLEFIESVSQEWWQNRAYIQEEGQEQNVEALAGFYGRYLGASGYHLVIEFTPEHTRDSSLKPILWRVDARPEGVQIIFPKDEGEVYNQLGAYLDLRQGWQWLINESIQSEALVTAEIEPGYMIGARPGNPLSDEDPADREDPEIEAAFSRFDIERFDTLEFLNSEDSEDYPFHSERFHTWLTEAVSEQLLTRDFEIFILSQSQKFFEAIEEVAERRKIEVILDEYEADPKLIFKRGPIQVERDFSLPYLWTLHSGRQHHEGAVQFFRDDVERIFSASELYFKVKRHLERAHGTDNIRVYVEDQDTLVVREAKGAKKPWIKVSLLEWAAEGLFDANRGVEQFLTLHGWSSESLQWAPPNHRFSHCPLCERESRLVKVIRPKFKHPMPKSIGIKLRDSLPKHLWGYYSLNCEQHRVPVFWEKGDILNQKIAQSTHQVVPINTEIEVMDEGLPLQLIWGDELAGSLLDSRTRESLRDRGALYAYAITPDLLVLSMLPINDEQCDRLEPHISKLITQFGPNRDWRLNWSVELR